MPAQFPSMNKRRPGLHRKPMLKTDQTALPTHRDFAMPSPENPLYWMLREIGNFLPWQPLAHAESNAIHPVTFWCNPCHALARASQARRAMHCAARRLVFYTPEHLPF